MASFKAVLFFALFAIACVMAEEAVREKKDIFYGAYPYSTYGSYYANDDGSYWPGKYEGLARSYYPGYYPGAPTIAARFGYRGYPYIY